MERDIVPVVKDKKKNAGGARIGHADELHMQDKGEGRGGEKHVVSGLLEIW